MFRSILNAQLNQDARHDLHRAVSGKIHPLHLVKCHLENSSFVLFFSDSQWVVQNLNHYKTFLTVHNGKSLLFCCEYQTL